jgi:hypothetical protein
MKWLLVAFVALHGLIHFMGPAKALGLAELPQLTQPISRTAAAGWALAGLVMFEPRRGDLIASRSARRVARHPAPGAHRSKGSASLRRSARAA